MRLARTREQLGAQLAPWRQARLKTALVPTMGNLHDGHLELVRAAREHADRVVASIYVNPAQFGEGEDFARYPRTLDADLQQLEAVGCDLAFTPSDDAMYPHGLDDAVGVRAAASLAGLLEGARRPGHFDGVLTVVARLFNLVAPDLAVFGEKDYQQLLVVQRMVEDLAYGLRVIAVPTVRAGDGLALSSRNRYLDSSQREAAAQLNLVLRDAAGQLGAAGAEPQRVEQDAAKRLERAGFSVDYVAVRRAGDLGVPGPGERPLRVLAAARCGTTRLIDNWPVE